VLFVLSISPFVTVYAHDEDAAFHAMVATTTQATVLNKTTLSRNLSLGMKGDDVTALQQYLITTGILKASATGYFGPATRSAVRIFQKQNKLAQVGNVGPATRGVLNVLFGRSVKDCGSVASDSIVVRKPVTAEVSVYQCFINQASLCSPVKMSLTGSNPGSIEVQGIDGMYCKFLLKDDKLKKSFSCKYSMNNIATYTQAVGSLSNTDTLVERAQSFMVSMALGSEGIVGINSITNQKEDLSCVKN
jgi:peptidoglycan hydrolase-like protein with peptidoglycan-binding domain